MAIQPPMLGEEGKALLSTLARHLATDAAYLVGGCLRDLLLGRSSRDVDIAVTGDALAQGRRLAAALNGHFVPLDVQRGMARVVLPRQGREGPPWQIDLTTLDGDIGADLARRDFTIDAMALPLTQRLGDWQAGLIDPCGGRRDLARRLVRAVTDDVFRADGLRLLRAVRLCAELGFDLEATTAAAARRDAARLLTAAAERQRDELMRILDTPRAGWALQLMDELGLLCLLIPELAAGKGVEQPKEHYYDVFGHSLAAVEALDLILAEEEPPQAAAAVPWRELWGQLAWSPEARRRWRETAADGHSRGALAKMAALLHDIAKPETRTVEADGRLRFFSHAEAGAEVAAAVMRRLRFSAASVRLVATMVEEHLRPPQMAQDGPPSRRALFRYFRDAGEAAVDILFLSLADHWATRGPRLDPRGWRAHVNLVNYILASRQQEELVRPPRQVSGHDLMRELGLAPGPTVGRLLAAIAEAQAAGEVSDRETALALARRELERLPSELGEPMGAGPSTSLRTGSA